MLLIKSLLIAVLMGDLSDLLPATINIILLFLLYKNSVQIKVAILSWAWIYLLILTGIKAGAKSLVILGGNGWEINTLRYGIDIFLVVLGLFIIIFRKYIFFKKKD